MSIFEGKKTDKVLGVSEYEKITVHKMVIERYRAVGQSCRVSFQIHGYNVSLCCFIGLMIGHFSTDVSAPGF